MRQRWWIVVNHFGAPESIGTTQRQAIEAFTAFADWGEWKQMGYRTVRVVEVEP
jgi:hypothetical protein